MRNTEVSDVVRQKDRVLAGLEFYNAGRSGGLRCP